MIDFIRSIYFTRNFFIALGTLAFIFMLGYFTPFVLGVSRVLLLLLVAVIVFEIVQLFRLRQGIEAKRDAPKKLSNGDDNHIYIQLQSFFPFDTEYEVIDELPVQFQSRDKTFRGKLKAGQQKTIRYTIRPTERGKYSFGNINIYLSTLLHLVQRRFQTEAGQHARVYPSILQVKKYSFMAISNHLKNLGIKKIRRIGHNYEFDQIREFVLGDDFRSINWKATARTSQLMVNQYQDEKSQEVYAIVNQGRVMQMPFEELALLDYAINSALVMLNTAFAKDDQPGLITFNKEVQTMLPASKKHNQITEILESLHNLETDYSEANYAKLTYWVRQKIKKRSLVFLYTNFEGMVSLQRELEHLKTIARYQRLIVVIFKNAELHELIDRPSNSMEDIYTKTIARKFEIEKTLIVKELNRHGIDAILTAPQHLTVSVINKYLEIKARGLF